MSRAQRGDERASAESADRDARDKTAAIWKPFHQDGHGNDVAESESDPADKSVAEIQPPQFICGEAREKNAEAVERCGGERNRTRPRSIHP